MVATQPISSQALQEFEQKVHKKIGPGNFRVKACRGGVVQAEIPDCYISESVARAVSTTRYPGMLFITAAWCGDCRKIYLVAFDLTTLQEVVTYSLK